jgi:hypothetical protein
MILKIQKHLTQYLSRLLAFALLLFILVGFNFQMILASAQGVAPATPTAPATPPKTNTFKEDSRIGAITKCSVDRDKNSDKLKSDPTYANNFIFECIRDIIRIVITISIILAVMNLMWIGIKFLNTFGSGDALNKELSERITGFVVGAVILGLFASIIQVVNPAALKIDKIFSAQVIADYKCLNKGIKDPGANTVSASGCNNGNQGAGPTGSKTVGTVENNGDITTLLKSGTDSLQTQTSELLNTCNSSYGVASASQASACKNYQNYPAAEYAANVNGPINDQISQSTIQGESFANGDYSDITVSGNVISTMYTRSKFGKDEVGKITFILVNPKSCESNPFLAKPTKISRGEKINNDGCKMQVKL